MNNKQQEKYAELVDHFETRCTLTPDLLSLLETLARVDVEENALQAYCDEYGTTYVTNGGVSRQRPEWQQLKENRQRKTAIVGALLRAFPIDGARAEPSELDKFFA
jgi:hypothetical protein